jgi:PAS domain S-box-containing protein
VRKGISGLIAPCLWFCLCGLALLPVAARAATPLSVQLNWKHQFEFAAFYAAQEHGYYRDVGLEVTIREGGPGVDAVKEVVEGRADFGVGTSELVVERYRGKPVVALATLMQHSPIALLAYKKNGLESIHDLANKPIAVDPHSRDEIEAFLLASGIPAQRINLVPQTDWTLKSLHQGREAAKVVYVSNEPFHIQGKEHEYLLFTPQSAGIDLFGNMLFTTDSAIARHHDTVEAFRDATLKGLAYALDHAEEISELILASYNTQNKTRAHLLFEAARIRELTRADIVEPGYMSPGRWHHVAEVYADRGKLPRNFDLAGFIHSDEPPATPVWLTWTLFASLVGLLAALLAIVKIRQLNTRLAKQIAERVGAEAALRESEADYRELVHNANAIILRMARDGSVSFFNEYAVQFFGYAAAEVLGKPVIGTIVPRQDGDGRDLGDLISGILADPAAHADNENENVTKDGRRVVVRWTNRAIFDEQGECTGVLSIGQDVTARKAMEQELATHRERLEDLVGVRTAELVAARRDAERLANVKSEFLANMSHEIRTPLHAILGFARIGARKAEDGEKAREAFGKIQTSGQRLLGIINDILDFSRIEAGKLRIEQTRVSIREVVDHAIDLIRDAAGAKPIALQIRLAPDLPPSCISDPLRLGQVLLNLLTNAVKFTAEGSVTLDAARRGDQLVFRVTDTGIGMDQAQLGELFIPFHQGDASTTRKFGGSGLGLTICKRIVELMDGDIEVGSEAGVGTSVEFRLPYVPTEAEAADPLAVREEGRPVAGKPLSGISVLVAEDDPVNQAILQESLSEDGARVVMVSDGQAAVERVRADGHAAFDVVLMDLHMPVMDGYQAASRIRELAPGLPVIAQTAHALSEAREKCLAAGMVGHIAKPIDLDALVALLRSHVSAPPSQVLAQRA